MAHPGEARMLQKYQALAEREDELRLMDEADRQRRNSLKHSRKIKPVRVPRAIGEVSGRELDRKARSYHLRPLHLSDALSAEAVELAYIHIVLGGPNSSLRSHWQEFADSVEQLMR